MIKLIDIFIFIIIILIIVCLKNYSKENFFFINRKKCKQLNKTQQIQACKKGWWPCCKSGVERSFYTDDWQWKNKGKCIKHCDKVYREYEEDNVCTARSSGVPLYPSDGESWNICQKNTWYKTPCPLICSGKNGENLGQGDPGFMDCLNRSATRPELLDECTRNNLCYSEKQNYIKTIPMSPQYKECLKSR
jgi:hypothetical protein